MAEFGVGSIALGVTAMLLSTNEVIQTPPITSPLQEDVERMQIAIHQAAQGIAEGGIPIGAALVKSTEFSPRPNAQAMKFTKEGKLLGVGRNRRVQSGSATRHGEVRYILYLEMSTDWPVG